MGFVYAVPIQPPSGAPQNFTVSVNGPRALTFSWKPPLEDQQNGPIVGYYLLCSSTQFGDYEMNISSDEYLVFLDDALTISDILPNSSYNCSLSAATSAGRGPGYSLPVSTPEDGISSTFSL